MDISYNELTPREQTIIQGLVAGQNTSQLVKSIDSYPKTVRDALPVIYGKTGTSNKPELIHKFSKPLNASASSLLKFLQKLSPEQREVADMLADGKGDKDIRKATGLTTERVRYHIKTISIKMAAITGEKPKHRNVLGANILAAKEIEAAQPPSAFPKKRAAAIRKEAREAADETVRQKPSYQILWNLTKRETTLVAELISGDTNREIAARLHISEQVVKNYTRKIQAKAGTENRIRTAVIAARLMRQDEGAEGNFGWKLENPLAPREAEALPLIADGLGNQEIALNLGISKNTVNVVIRKVLEKLGADNRTHAAIIFDKELGSPTQAAPAASANPASADASFLGPQASFKNIRSYSRDITKPSVSDKGTAEVKKLLEITTAVNTAPLAPKMRRVEVGGQIRWISRPAPASQLLILKQ